MTREETKKAIEVMQAYVDEKEIEDFYAPAFNNAWQLQQDPTWNWTNREYRIKEESKIHYMDHNIQCVVKAAWKEEPKPFDWRGKNIQWVRHKNYDAVLRVVYLSDVGIGMTTLYTNDKEELNAPEIWPWEKVKAWFEWSEDNATWRKFE